MNQTSASDRPDAVFRDLYAGHVDIVASRTRAALDSHGYAAAVVHAGRIHRKSPFDDADWPFSPVPMFRHWSPLNWPDSAVVVTNNDVTLWAVRATDFWERPAEPDWSLIRAGLNVEIVESFDAVKTAVPDGKVAFISHDAEAASALGIPVEHVNPSDLVVAMEDTRVEKTPYEVEAMAAASRWGVAGHRAAAEAFLAGERSELRIHLAFLEATRQDDADTPYKGIVALGEAAATLHHNVYADRPSARSLLVDAGARVNGYPCDITRTHVAPGDGAAAAFAALIDGMDRLQRSTVDDISVGMNYEDLHDACHRRLGDLMAEQGLVSCSGEAAAAEGVTRAFFPHGLGHALGVQVHDVSCRKRAPRPENRFLRHTGTITEGQVFTIEPGLYFIEALLDDLRAKPAGALVRWDAVEPLYPFGGIRIEDDVYVRPDGGGVRNLTRDAFAERA